MLEITDIEKLAKLARINLSDEEKQKLPKEVDGILGYVAQIKQVTSSVSEDKKAGEPARMTIRSGGLRNVVRIDENPTQTGLNTNDIVANMPDSKDGYLKVEKIL